MQDAQHRMAFWQRVDEELAVAQCASSERWHPADPEWSTFGARIRALRADVSIILEELRQVTSDEESQPAAMAERGGAHLQSADQLDRNHSKLTAS